MTTVTLAELLSVRDESIALRRPSRAWRFAMARIVARGHALNWKPARAALMAAVLSLAGFLSTHVLVIAGCAAFVIGAAIVAPVAGWIVAGAALFFLEARRR